MGVETAEELVARARGESERAKAAHEEMIRVRGELLKRAKSLCPRGSWEGLLAEHWPGLSAPSAENYITVAGLRKSRPAVDRLAIGAEMLEAKKAVGHGNWIPVLRRRWPGVSVRTAQLYMMSAAKCMGTYRPRARKFDNSAGPGNVV